MVTELLVVLNIVRQPYGKPLAKRSPLLHLVMPIQSVLSSASNMRLGAPGAPSLIAIGEPAENVAVALAVRLTTVRLPVKRPSDCSCCPTTYIVVVDTSALLEPPGTPSVQE